jgi:hypothetical protein
VSPATWPWSPRPARRPGHRIGQADLGRARPQVRALSGAARAPPGTRGRRRRGDPRPVPHRRRRQPALAGHVADYPGQSPAAPIAANVHLLHSQSPAAATEGSRERAVPGQSGHRPAEVTLAGRPSAGRYQVSVAASRSRSAWWLPVSSGSAGRRVTSAWITAASLGRAGDERGPGRRPTGSCRPSPGLPRS